MSELQDRLDNAIDSLKEWAEENPGSDPYDEISGIADNAVPVYTYDILQCAMDNLYLATEEPELGPAFDGSNTAVNIIAANVYEYIESKLHEAWAEIEEEIKEKNTPKVDPDKLYVFEIEPYIVTEPRTYTLTRSSFTVPMGMEWQYYCESEEIEEHEDNLIIRTPDFWSMFQQIVEFAAEVGLEHVEITWFISDSDIADMKTLTFNQKMVAEASHNQKVQQHGSQT